MKRMVGYYEMGETGERERVDEVVGRSSTERMSERTNESKCYDTTAEPWLHNAEQE